MFLNLLKALKSKIVTPAAVPPGLLQVELTSRCNINCAMCARSSGLSRQIGDMDIDLFKEIVDQSKYYSMPIGWFHHFGETLLYPHLREALAYFKARGVGNGAISTNALLLNEEKRDILIENASYVLCCVDSMRDEAYQHIRNNKKHALVLENVKSLIEERNKNRGECKIVIQFLRTTFNGDEEISEMMDYFGQHDNLKYIEKGTVKHPKGGDISLYSSSNNIDNRIGCCMAKTQLCILNSGDCVACCWDADGEQVIGRIGEQTLDKIWQGKRHKRLQSSVNVGDFSSLPLCARCSGPGTGDQNRIVEQVNAYIDMWKEQGIKVLLAPDGEAMRALIEGSRLREIRENLLLLKGEMTLPAPQGVELINLETALLGGVDTIFIYSPSNSAETYFALNPLKESGTNVVCLGSFLD